MSFFDQVPAPLPPERPREPEWTGPPENFAPAPFPLQLVLARTDEVAIVVHGRLA